MNARNQIYKSRNCDQINVKLIFSQEQSNGLLNRLQELPLGKRGSDEKPESKTINHPTKKSQHPQQDEEALAMSLHY
ncbi:hypothetical protein [Serratia fonticola]